MTVFQVPNMHCEMCVARIRKGFIEAGIEAEIVLAQKTVTVADAQKEKAAELLDDLGFDVA